MARAMGLGAVSVEPRFRGCHPHIQPPSAYALGYILTPSGLSENTRLARA